MKKVRLHLSVAEEIKAQAMLKHINMSQICETALRIIVCGSNKKEEIIEELGELKIRQAVLEAQLSKFLIEEKQQKEQLQNKEHILNNSNVKRCFMTFLLAEAKGETLNGIILPWIRIIASDNIILSEQELTQLYHENKHKFIPEGFKGEKLIKYLQKKLTVKKES